MTDYEIILDEPHRGAQVLTPHVDIETLTCRAVAPGGFGAVNFQLAREVDARDFEPDSDILVYDGETGEQIGGARILNPGRSTTGEDEITDAGDYWDVAANGEGPTHLAEREVPYLVIDTRTSPTWDEGDTSGTRFQWQEGEIPQPAQGIAGGSVPGWSMITTPGTLGNGDFARLNAYDMEQYAAVGGDHRIEIAGIRFSHLEGNDNDSNNFVQLLVSTFDGNNEELLLEVGFDADTANVRRRYVGGATSTPVDPDPVTGDEGWPAGGIGPSDDLPVVRVTIRYDRDGSTVTVGGDDDWMHVWNMMLQALRLDRAGDALTGNMYETDYVLAHEVLIDCLARFCPRIDLAGARIDTTATFQHQDLVWPDGITPYGVLEKLLQYDPAFTWGVWERLPSGLHAFEWRELDTEVRYEIPYPDVYTQTASEATQLDAVHVLAESKNGKYRVLTFYRDGVDEEDVRTSKTIKFDGQLDSTGFSEAASALGHQTLEESELRASAAQVEVSGMVLDLYTGRYVSSDKIRPSYLARIGDVTVDGAAVYRIVSNDHAAAGGGSSKFELNTYTLTETEAIAALLNNARVTV
jgi:hypothetical protein